MPENIIKLNIIFYKINDNGNNTILIIDNILKNKNKIIFNRIY